MRNTGKLLRARMKKLIEEGLILLPKPQVAPEYTDDDKLVAFEAAEKIGAFALEPDFPIALAFFRDALQRAKTQTNPPYDPPADFADHMPECRLRWWRDKPRFPDLAEAREWLEEMARRLHCGIPAVSTVEFQELADWFNANYTRLRDSELPSGLLDHDQGHGVNWWTIRCDLMWQGVRQAGAGIIAENIRRMRAQYDSGDKPAE